MHCNSKLTKFNERIKFLEKKLYDNSMFIDDLATKLNKLKFSSIKKSKHTREQNLLQNYVDKNKGKVI